MTGENREHEATVELERARTCLEEARTLEEAGLAYGAASRAYFAVFHAAQALLFSAGLQARSHHGVASLLGEHFVKPGTLSSEMGRLLSRMQRDREDADYLSGAVFTGVEARELVENAERFLDEIVSLL